MAKTMSELLKEGFNSLYGYPVYKLDDDSTADETTPAEPEETPEEWVWIDGYKGTDKNMVCRDQQFELGKRYDMAEDADIEVCKSGFHLCKKLKDVYGYYAIENDNRFFKVAALVRKQDAEKGSSSSAGRSSWGFNFATNNDKLVAKSIIFTQELTPDEILAHVNGASEWTEEQKQLALREGPKAVEDAEKVEKLVALDYSRPFAEYIARNGYFDMAYVIGQQPGVSMDVKVLTIFRHDL